jgi:Homeodomain-like domain
VNKKYVVELTRAERERLLKLVSSGTAPARMLNRARVLLKADADGPDRWTDERIARALDTSVATVGRVRKRFCRQGLEAALKRSLPDRVYERSLDGRAEARLIALACSEAPEGRDRWSMRLLADKAVELGIVESLSHETVRKTLKKTSSVPTSSKGG